MLRLRVQIDSQAAERLEGLLFTCGAVSVSYEDAADNPILEPKIGDHPLWSNLILQAHFTDQSSMQLATSALENEPSISAAIILDQIDDQGWQESFQQEFGSMQFGPLWIYPSWEDNPAPNGISLQLDPGFAFGTGRHPTTSLCLNWLGNTHLKNLAVTDFGCGSGILALAAARLGAEHVHAVDIDPQALTATHENIRRNNIPYERFTVGRANCLGNTTSDIIISNILASPLLELRETFIQHLKLNGTLVASGILDSQTSLIIEQYSQQFECLAISSRQEWACISFKRIA